MYESVDAASFAYIQPIITGGVFVRQPGNTVVSHA